MFRTRTLRNITEMGTKVKTEIPEWAKHKQSPLIPYFNALGTRLMTTAQRVISFSNQFMGVQPPEALYRIPRLLRVSGERPTVKDNCFVAPSAFVSGDVRIGRKNYIGYNAIIRAEKGESIHLGESCSVQEKAVVTGNTTVGKWATIEPMAIVESADIASCSFVGAAAIMMKGSRMESGSMLCAGSVLQAGAIIPSGEMWAGNPAEKVADLTEKEKDQIIKAAKHTVLLAIEHHDSWELTWEEVENQRLAREHFARYAERNREVRAKAMYIKEPPRPNRKPQGRWTPQEMVSGAEHQPALRESVIQGY